MLTSKVEVQKILGLAVLLGGVALGITGCGSDGRSPFGIFATEEYIRNYVQQQTAPLEAGIAKVDARVTQVDGRVTQVAAQTTEARKVADDGVRRATAADTRVTQALANRYKRTLVETITLPYAPNQFVLTSQHTEILARVLKVLEDNPTYTADIIGYTDASGTRQLNNQLSWRREEVVRRHLTDQAPVLHRISFIGLGEEKANVAKTTAAADRQVTIVIYRPDL